MLPPEEDIKAKIDKRRSARRQGRGGRRLGQQDAADALDYAVYVIYDAQ
jgi:hypothetical protein